MKGTIVLQNVNKDSHNPEYKFEEEYETNKEMSYLITINTDLSNSFENLSSENQREHIINSYNNLEIYARGSLRLIMEKYKNNEHNLIKDAEEVILEFDMKEAIEYLKNNKELYSKKIIINGSIYDELDNEMFNVLNNIPNIYIKIEQNKELITLDEFIKTRNIIESIVKEIESFNFSTLEKIMYAYDITRDRVYKKEESKNENISRDLTSVLLQDKIVCLGYAVIFNTILNKLGIKTNIIALYNRDESKGHAINAAYVKDDKYDIDGVYYFDTTADRKVQENSNKHMLKYRYFGRTIRRSKKLEKGFIDEKTESITKFLTSSSHEIVTQEIIDGILDRLFILEHCSGVEALTEINDIINTINYMSTLTEKNIELKKDILILSTRRDRFREYINNEGKELIGQVVSYFTKPISTETFIEALYNVRKQQYYINPEKYPFSKEDFLAATVKSGRLFDEVAKNPQNKVAGMEEIKSQQEQYYNNYVDNNSLEKDISTIKLVRTLKSISNKKQR